VEIWAEIEEEGLVLGFLGNWAEIEGRRESIEEGRFVVGFLSKWEIWGSKTKCEDEAKRRKIDCWWVFISGSGRFRHKTNKCE
jgi:hypothetical protein